MTCELKTCKSKTCWDTLYEQDDNFLMYENLNSTLYITDGKYVVLPSGELQIRNVSPEDGFKTYKCRTKHRLTGETKLSATAGRLVITGKFAKTFELQGC